MSRPSIRQQRQQRRQHFLDQSSFAGASLQAMPADASFRQYFRVNNGRCAALLMDAPPPEEDVRPFVRIARHLQSLGLSAPRLFDCDEDQGFLLLEDFGDDTYTQLLESGESEYALYALAIDALSALHLHPAATEIEAPPYDASTCVEEAMLFAEWYLPRAFDASVEPHCSQAYREAWVQIFETLPTPVNSLILRDYHVDNLMRLKGQDGIQACGLLDFQDAAIGSTAYDVVSLLEDARRDISIELAAAMRQRYRDNLGLDDAAYADFMLWYYALGAQRHCRVLGVFVRLFERDGKAVYLQHLPRLERLLRWHLEVAQMAPLRDWIHQYLNFG